MSLEVCELIPKVLKGCDDSFLEIVEYVHDIIDDISRMKVKGHDEEDLRSECYIALRFDVISRFDSSKGTFRAFAALVMKRRLYSVMKAETRHKRNILNRAKSIHGLLESLDCGTPTPYAILEQKDRIQNCMQKLSSKLSQQESEVAHLFVRQNSYARISEMTGYRIKTIDNALQRTRRKAAGVTI